MKWQCDEANHCGFVSVSSEEIVLEDCGHLSHHEGVNTGNEKYILFKNAIEQARSLSVLSKNEWQRLIVFATSLKSKAANASRMHSHARS
jgi:hypothetical protein